MSVDLDKLKVSVCGISLKHPIMNASGILGALPEHIEIMASWGLSAVVTKTITPEPREGNPPPIIIELKCGGLLNAVGLANPGLEGLKGLCAKAKELGIPLIVSVGGRTPEDFVKVATKAEEFGAIAIELNLSCPHTPGYGAEIGSDPNAVFEIVKSTSSVLKIPVIAKFGLHDNLMKSMDKALEGGAKGLTLINTVRAMAIDVYSAKPMLSNVFGGLSGPPIHPIAVRIVYEAYREYGVDIIGCGGVFDWEDAAELILAGARAIQVGSALMKCQGEEIVTNILRGLSEWLHISGFKSLEEAIGAAHRR